MSTGDINYDRINDYGSVRISLASPHAYSYELIWTPLGGGTAQLSGIRKKSTSPSS